MVSPQGICETLFRYGYVGLCVRGDWKADIKHWAHSGR